MKKHRYCWSVAGVVVILAGGVALARGKSAAPGPDGARDEPAVEPDRGPVFRADEIVENWQDLLGVAQGVYLATAEKVPRSGPGDHYDWCYDRIRTALPEDRPPSPERLCAPPWETFGAVREAGGCGEHPVSAWLVTAVEGDREVPFAVQGECGSPDDLGELALYRDTLVQAIRCGQIGRVWSEIPPSARACRHKADCTVISGAGNCFDQALSVDAAEPYQEVFDRHGAGCEYARMGMCSPREILPECREGVCAIKGHLHP